MHSVFPTHHLSWDATGILRQATRQEIIKVDRKGIGYEVRGLDLSDSRLNSIGGLYDYTVHHYYQPLYYPTNTLTCIKCMVIKNIKNIKTAPTCFGSRGNHPQGANVST